MFWRARNWLLEKRRPRILGQAVQDLLDLPPNVEPADYTLKRLILGWGNDAWSAGPAYLAAVWRAASSAHGPILECGSGLTTLLAAIASRHAGTDVHALEDNDGWAHRVNDLLSLAGITNAEVHVTPLDNYGDFDWYRVPPFLPPCFSLVICDGPPGTTLGGRSGLMPVMAKRLKRNCVILLDDVQRPTELETIRQWQTKVRLENKIFGSERRYAHLTVMGVI